MNAKTMNDIDLKKYCIETVLKLKNCSDYSTMTYLAQKLFNKMKSPWLQDKVENTRNDSVDLD